MEALGAPAAGIAFLQFLQTTNTVYSKFASASADLESIAEHIDWLEKFCTDLSLNCRDVLDTQLVDLVAKVRALAADFRSQSKGYDIKTGVKRRQRLRFITKDLPKLERLQARARTLADITLKYLVK